MICTMKRNGDRRKGKEGGFSHGKASILDLLQLELLDGARDKEGEARVPNLVVSPLVVGEEGIHVDRVGVPEVLPPLDLNKVHGPELNGDEAEDGDGGLELVGVIPEEVWPDDVLGQNSSSSKHGPSGVNAL